MSDSISFLKEFNYQGNLKRGIAFGINDLHVIIAGMARSKNGL